MKIALAQINTTVTALEKNTKKILFFIQKAKQQDADLVIFPEMTITGYPPKDYLEKEWFIEKNIECLHKIAQHTQGIAALVGYVDFSQKKEGKGLCNACAILSNGKIVSTHFKTLLPTYDVFDEGRYFDPAPDVSVAEVGEMRLGISICEDMWNDELYWKKRFYKKDPIRELCEKKIDLLINISASPFTLGKRSLKEGMYRSAVARCRVPLVYVNLVGANDSLIFDGGSLVMNEHQEVVAQAADFKEDIVYYDTERKSGDMHPTTDEGMERLLEALNLGLRDYVTKCGFEKVILGLSGGIDSAVVAGIATLALGSENVVTVSMPSKFSSEGSKTDAENLSGNLNLKYLEIYIQRLYDEYLKQLHEHFKGTQFDVAEENLQARIRGNILMALSNKHGYLVLSTGNKSELAVGYCTLYGDMVGGLGVIADVPKTMVYELARFINREKEIIPNSILEKAPSAELRPNQTDQDSLPPYEILDEIITAYIEEKKSVEEMVAMGLDRSIVEAMVRRIDRNEYKRSQAALGLKVTTRAFGYGWRMPIATGNEEI